MIIERSNAEIEAMRLRITEMNHKLVDMDSVIKDRNNKILVG
jgi:hypothetical protein